MRKYNKLVRDKIPDVIKAKGELYTIRVLPEAEFKVRLEEKLDEELAEFHASKTPEELADLVEVIRAVTKSNGWSWEQLERIRREKLEARGGFKQKLLLLEVQDAESSGQQAAGWLMDRFTQQQ